MGQWTEQHYKLFNDVTFLYFIPVFTFSPGCSGKKGRLSAETFTPPALRYPRFRQQWVKIVASIIQQNQNIL